MPVISVKQSRSGNTPDEGIVDIYDVLVNIQLDIEALRNLLATHVHSGVTTGASNTAVPTVTIAATALNTQP